MLLWVRLKLGYPIACRKSSQINSFKWLPTKFVLECLNIRFKLCSKYAWILQYAGGIGLFLNGLQFLSLFPGHEGLLTGVSNALLAIGTLIPQLWLLLITKMNIVTFSQVIFIWMVLAILSFLLGLMIYPWENMPESESKPGDFDAFYQKLKKKQSVCEMQGDFVKQVRQSLVLMKSPIFIVHVTMFAVGNCTATLSLNFVNDFMFWVQKID